MLRKKAKKEKKTSMKMTTLAERLEKDLLVIVAQLPAQFRQDLEVLQKKTAQLADALKKANAQGKLTGALLAKGDKKALTATAKKKLVSAKKTYTSLNQTIKRLTLELAAAKKQEQAFTLKKKQFSALKKHIEQLSKVQKVTVKKAVKKINQSKKKIAKSVNAMIGRALSKEDVSPVSVVTEKEAVTS